MPAHRNRAGSSEFELSKPLRSHKDEPRNASHDCTSRDAGNRRVSESGQVGRVAQRAGCWIASASQRPATAWWPTRKSHRYVEWRRGRGSKEELANSWRSSIKMATETRLGLGSVLGQTGSSRRRSCGKQSGPRCWTSSRRRPDSLKRKYSQDCRASCLRQSTSTRPRGAYRRHNS